MKLNDKKFFAHLAILPLGRPLAALNSFRERHMAAEGVALQCLGPGLFVAKVHLFQLQECFIDAVKRHFQKIYF